MSKLQLFFIIVTIFISVTTILAYTVYRLKIEASKNIVKRQEQQEIEAIQNLKNSIDIAYSVIDSLYQKSIQDKYLEENYGHHLKNIIEIVEKILEFKSERVKKGELTLTEAQVQATEEINKIRYDDNKGYIEISDTTLPYPKMIMHPLQPSLNGIVMNSPNYNRTKDKKNIYAAFVEITQQNGEGFIGYFSPKQNKDDLIQEVLKISYVKLFPEWNWLLSTGMYVDEMIEDTKTQIKETIRKMKYNNTGYFWIIDITDKSSPKYVMHPHQPERENKALEGELSKLKARVETFIKVCDENKNGNNKYHSGLVKYSGEKPTEQGLLVGAPKLTFVGLYEPLHWIIGTGAYIDGIEKSVAEEKKFINEQINRLIINILSAAILIVFLIGTLNYLVNHHYFLKIQFKQNYR